MDFLLKGGKKMERSVFGDKIYAMFWYAVSAYRKFKDKSFDELKEIGKELSDLSSREPLDQVKGPFRLSFGEVTGLQALTYMIVVTDLLSGGQLRERDEYKWLRDVVNLI